MSGLNWDVDPASIQTTPALSERELAHVLALALNADLQGHERYADALAWTRLKIKELTA